MYRTKQILLLSVVLLTLLFACKKEEHELPVKKILLIGSSFTGNYHNYIDSLVACNNDSIIKKVYSIGNGTFKKLTENNYFLNLLSHEKYDYYMLQEAAYMSCLKENEVRNSTVLHLNVLLDTIKKFNPEARIGLYMPHAYEFGHADRCSVDTVVCDYWGMQKRIIDNHIIISQHFNIELAPVGFVWMKFKEKYPNVDLYTDSFHGSPEGRYLTACVVFSIIFKKSIVDTPVPSDLLFENAQLIQQFVNDLLNSNNDWQKHYLQK